MIWQKCTSMAVGNDNGDPMLAQANTEGERHAACSGEGHHSQDRPELAAEIAATATRLSAEILHKDPKVTAVIAEEVPGERRFCGGVSLADKGLASFWLDIRITESTNTKDEKAAFIAETFRAMEALLGPLHEESYACA